MGFILCQYGVYIFSMAMIEGHNSLVQRVNSNLQESDCLQGHHSLRPEPLFTIVLMSKSRVGLLSIWEVLEFIRIYVFL